MRLRQPTSSERRYTDWRVRSRTSSDLFPISETEQTIHERFDKQVLSLPSQASIKSKDTAITYAVLNKTANRIARAIIAESGNKPGQIALLFGLNAAAISAILGVLKSGRVYVPIDPSWPQDWSSFILDNSEATVILANHRTLELAGQLAHKKCHVINIDEIDSGVSDENPELRASPDSPAYILYTSGSTGRAKGVVQTHRNLLQLIRNYTNNLGITSADRLLLLHSLSFGASPMNLYGALLNGATVYPYNVREEGTPRLAYWLTSEQITVCHFGPTLFRHFAGALAGDCRFPALRLINLGGEPVYARDIELFKNHFASGCTLVNSLACTEAGTFAQYFIDHDSEVSGERIPAGHAFGDIEISLLDDHGNEAAAGQIGEIVLKGGYLSPGYWRNPELTQKVFLADPGQTGKRMFFTGDIGRVSPDGLLEHLGRKDFQVKIRGYRIEITEIEAVMRRIGDIKEAVVVGVDDQGGDKRLVAYVVVTQESTRPSVTELRTRLGQRLPEYMIPSQFIFLDALPLTQSGKVDRNSLRVDRTINRPPLQATFLGPRSDIEKKMEAMWTKLLRVREVGIDDNFFDLGGDSVMAIELLLWTEKEFGKRLSPYELFQSPTIRQLSTLVIDRETSKAKSCLVPMKPEGSRIPLFLLPSVRESILMFRELIKYLDPEQPVYGIEGSEDVLLKPIKETASHYVNEICRVFPSGPFLLIGFSSGGIMAFEMAQQLLNIHREVALVGMLDTFFPSVLNAGFYRRKRIFAAPFIRNLPFWLYYSVPFWIKHYWHIAVSRRPSITNQPAPDYNMRQIIQWLQNYSPGKYSGRIILYQARAQRLFEADQQREWRNVCDSVETYAVPGHHLSILKKTNAQFLAEKINLELDRVCTEGFQDSLQREGVSKTRHDISDP
ncbi:MAG TPA: amino acid adenylation domain-containing protein [Thermodesulfovibrionales bacterium]|nr:amino acid adenylation domain-containing protein [Thermodesulfovibrionales bacterium]